MMYLTKQTLQTHGAQRTQVKLSRNQGNANRAECKGKNKDRTSTQARDNPKWSHPS